MAKVDMRWRPGALRELRSSDGPVADLNARLARVHRTAESLGGKFYVGSRMGVARPQGRWRGIVAVADYKARRINARDHTLLQALNSGR